MHFIKLGEKYINLDNVTTIEPKSDLGYVVHFVGQTHSRSICEMDMADIRREFEKVQMLQDLDKVVLKNEQEKDYTHVTRKEDGPEGCRECLQYGMGKDGFYGCSGSFVCPRKLARIKK